ncbi:MAG: ABC transporter permease, partial [Holophagales bacterium]|nr:ABC transporter permease [Holophagales bacterium]
RMGRDVNRGAHRGASADRGSSRLREALVVAEVAMACVLLVLGALLLERFRNVLDTDLGFRPDQLVRWQINTSRDFETLEAENAYFQDMVEGVKAVPGVEKVGLTDAIPFGRNRTWGVGAPGYEYDGNPRMAVFVHVVDAGYLDVMGIPLLEGRGFSADDTDDRPQVLLLNQSAARALFHGEDALGRTVQVGDQETQVVGVVADVRHRSLELDAGAQMYLPMTQNADFGAVDLVVRSRLGLDALAVGVRTAIHAQDPSLPAREYRSLDSVVAQTVSPRRFTLQVLGSFSGTAVLLALLGIYGVLSYAVHERRRELAIRMALGETGGAVLASVVAKALMLTGLGLSLGVLGSLLVSRWSRSLLYGVEPGDPGTLAAMTALLLLVSTAAAFFPAWKASKTPVAAILTGD